MWNKKAEGTDPLSIVAWLVIIGLVVLVIALFVIPKIVSNAKGIDTYKECSVFNKKGGCFNEADKITKEDDGFLCLNNTGGCKSDISWCCYGTS